MHWISGGLLGAAALLLPLPANAEPLPAAESLLSDVRRVVAANEAAGWFIDEKEYAEIENTLLESACRTPPDARIHARSALAAQRPKDVRALYEAAGRRLTDRVEDALTDERRYLALERTLARLDECPFYVTPRPDFPGRQTERDKWLVHLEGGGVAELTRSDGEYAIGGGGSGRLLFGWGFDDRYSLLFGGETGGGAEVNRPSLGDSFKVKYTAAAPLVLRVHRINWFYDTELAPVATLKAANLDLSWGGRVGIGVGVTALRTRDILPWAGIAIATDHYWPQDGQPAVLILHAGLRVGLRWDP